MKRIFIKLMIMEFFLILFIPTTTAEVSKGFTYPEYSKTMSMDFQDANMKDVLKVFSQQSGLNFIASDEIKNRTVTLFLDNVPVEEALQRLLVANKLTYEMEKGSNIFIVKELPDISKTITKIYFLKYATVSNSRIKSEVSDGLVRKEEFGEGGGGGGASSTGITSIKDIVKNVLSDIGRVIEDPRTNSLVVTDKPEQFPVIEQAIARLDVPTPQVLIEVEILDVSKDSVDKLGVKWPQSLAKLDVTGARTTSFPLSTGSKFANNSNYSFSDVTSPSGKWKFSSVEANNFVPSVLTVIGAELALDFLRTQTDTKYLARPRILTLNNETAEIKIVTDEAIGIQVTSSGEAASAQQTSSAERTETGVALRVTPQVNLETGEITMFVEPTVSEAKTSNLSGFRDPERRQAKSMLRINDGETIVIGGLIRTQSSEVITKVPILGDIPLLGAVFRHKNKSKDEDRELMIFITPHILTEQKLTSASIGRYLPPFTREQELPISKKTEVEKALSMFEKKRR